MRMENQTTRFNDLPYEILVRIMMYMSIVDVVIIVSCVSKSWREACRDPRIWRVWDLDVEGSHWFTGRDNPLAKSELEFTGTQMRFLQSALNLSGGAVSTLIFPSMVFLRNEHLLYIAQRTRNVKQLVLPSWNLLDMCGFERAVMYWKDLEYLAIPCFHYPYDMMRIISFHCKGFSVLKIRCPLDLEFAKAVVEHVPRLKVLTLRFTILYKDGLAHLLKTMNDLEVLNVSHSQIVDHIFFGNEDGNAGSAKSRELDVEIVRGASQLKRLVSCQDILSKERCHCAYDDMDFDK